jgi:hypothetical protein
MTSSLAIACSSGTLKGVFVHGVLSAFETAGGIRAHAYAGVSSSVLSTASAAVGRSAEIGVGYWLEALRALKQPGHSMSKVVLQSISEYGPMLRSLLFKPGNPRFFIGASAVSVEAAKQTQGMEAKRLGRRLLLSATRGERDWVDKHLTLHLFDSAAPDRDLRLTAENFDAVAYASTRMLHAWEIPAWVGKQAYVDGSYTCACPAVEMAQRGYNKVVAMATEPGPLYRDIFRTDPVPDQWGAVPIFVVRPDVDPQELGVNFTNATEDGLFAVYRHGEEKGREFLDQMSLWT